MSRSKRARAWTHANRPGWSCNANLRGWCWRCFWRDITGQHRRTRAAELARIKAVIDSDVVPRTIARRNPDGTWGFTYPAYVKPPQEDA